MFILIIAIALLAVVCIMRALVLAGKRTNYQVVSQGKVSQVYMSPQDHDRVWGGKFSN